MLYSDMINRCFANRTLELQVENNLYWVLNVARREDQSRIRDENSVLNMSWLRKTAIGFWAKADYLIDLVKI